MFEDANEKSRNLTEPSSELRARVLAMFRESKKDAVLPKILFAEGDVVEKEETKSKRMRALLVRVGIDQTKRTGFWNGPVNSQTNEFAYVAISEPLKIRRGMEKPFSQLSDTLSVFGATLPKQLASKQMHLDPDFEFLSYGDVRERAKQLMKLSPGDLVVFYSGLRGFRRKKPHGRRLVYAIIGLFVIERIVLAKSLPAADRHRNAHTRRTGGFSLGEIVIFGNPNGSGRLERCQPIGSYRKRAYRVTPELIRKWGGLSVKDGYLQRSARLPEIKDAEAFYRWFRRLKIPFIQRNNPEATA